MTTDPDRPSAFPRLSERTLPTGPVLFVVMSAVAVLLSLLDVFVSWRKQGVAAFRFLYFKLPLFDLYCYRPSFAYLHTPGFYSPYLFPWTYPAPCLWIYRFLYQGNTQEGIWLLYLTSLLLLLAFAGFLFIIKLKQAGMPTAEAAGFVLSVVLLSWPLYFSAQRGNIEGFLWMAVALALGFYIQKRHTLAAIAIGFVAAFKIYPILLLALFLKRERWRELGLGILASVVTTYLGLRYIDRNVYRSFTFVGTGIRLFLSRYSATFDPDSIGFDHSAWSIFKRLTTVPRHINPQGLAIYTAVAAVAATALFFTRMRALPRKNQVLALCILTVLLPSTSFDYTLQILYLPFSWIVVDSVWLLRRRISQPGLTQMMICFALVLAPLTFIHGNSLFYGGQVKALALICLLVLAVVFPVPDSGDFHAGRSA